MEQTKLTVRIPRDLLENVKRYAAENHTTLTDLIEAYLRRIPALVPLITKGSFDGKFTATNHI